MKNIEGKKLGLVRKSVTIVGLNLALTAAVFSMSQKSAEAKTWACRNLGIGCPQSISGVRPTQNLVQTPNPEQVLTMALEGYEIRDGDWSFFPRPVVSKSFSDAERNKIWTALQKARDRINSDSVQNCIKKYVTKGYFGSEPQGMVVSMGLFATAHPELRLGQGRKLPGDDYH